MYNKNSGAKVVKFSKMEIASGANLDFIRQIRT